MNFSFCTLRNIFDRLLKRVVGQYGLVCTGMYNFSFSCTALYPEEDVLARTSTYHLVLPCTRPGGTGFQMLKLGYRISEKTYDVVSHIVGHIGIIRYRRFDLRYRRSARIQMQKRVQSLLLQTWFIHVSDIPVRCQVTGMSLTCL